MKSYVGVSGFSYATWKGKFYPKETKSEEFLGYYSKQLETVEINSSFYAPPKEAVVKGWAEKTSEEFRFSFKAPQLITHIMKLGKGSAEAANRFSKTLDVLGKRRGAVLFQLPPYMKADPDLLEEFLTETSEIPDRVFEFRHKTWLKGATYHTLEKHGTGFCIAETEEMAPEYQVTGELAYFRFRKDSYDPSVINRMAKKIAEVTKDVQVSYVYMRHDETGDNALFAQALSEKLQADTKTPSPKR